MTKKFKTHQKKRRTYTYTFSDGTTVTLTPGENGLTELDVKQLHQVDDCEVDSYYRNIRPKRTADEKSKIEEWKKVYIEEFKAEHGHEPHTEYVKYAVKERFPMNYATSLNAYEAEDKNSLLINAPMMTDVIEDVDPRAELLKELMPELTDSQRWLIQKVFYERISQTEIADELGITKQAIQSRLNKIYARMRSLFEK